MGLLVAPATPLSLNDLPLGARSGWCQHKGLGFYFLGVHDLPVRILTTGVYYLCW